MLPPTTTRPTDADALIALRDLVKIYPNGARDLTVLKGIDLDIPAGDFCAVIGKSGSGKSTLLNMVTGIDRPTSGEVWVGDVPVHSLSEDELAGWRGRHVGVVYQFFQLLPMLSLRENVMLPMDFCGTYAPRVRKQRAMELLDRVGLADHAHKPPSSVSGGQQQRAAIARALANDPDLIIADEPTGNLDSQTADSVFALFGELASQGKTIVIVTHDTAQAMRTSRILVLADGEVVQDGTALASEVA